MIVYFVIINIISALITVYDKTASQSKKTRVPERLLMALGIIGGALGMFITMIIIRHKTRHVKFMLGLPLIFIVQVLLAMIFIH